MKSVNVPEPSLDEYELPAVIDEFYIPSVLKTPPRLLYSKKQKISEV